MLLLLGFCLAMVALLGRLAYWQFYKGEELAEKGRQIRAFEAPMKAPRGTIVDRHGRPLAENLTAWSVAANPREVREPAAVAARLAPILNLQAADIQKLLEKRVSYVYIKRKAADAQYQQLRALKDQKLLPGISLEPEARRYYPEGALAAHVIGIAGLDNQGLEGLERYYDDELRGQDGSIEAERDARGYEIAGGERRVVPPRPGYTAVLCLDKALQLILEQAADRAMAVTQSKRAALMVMDVRTGCLLAIASRPAFDPNNYQNTEAKDRRMWLVADAVSPGSIFKPVTAAGAMEEGLVNLTTPFHDPGCIVFAPGTPPVCNWNNAGFGSGTIVDVMKTSSNVGFGQIGLMLGADRFYKYLDLFSLTRRTGIDLPGEAVGLQLPLKVAREHPRDLATQAFGQTLTVTPVQMLAAINAIANDGKWVQPHLLMEFRDASGQPVQPFRPRERQIISPETAREVQGLMEKVVAEGTGRGAQVPGYGVAGKTGTAEKFVDGKKLEGVYIASFAGFAPVPAPKVSVLVMIDEPGGGLRYGGQIAAPVFSQIMGDLLRYLQIPPRAANAPAPNAGARSVPVPNFINLPLELAQNVAREAGLTLVVGGGGGALITAQVPPAGATLAPGATVQVRADPGPPPAPGQASVRVPDLTGLTLRQAADLLSGMGLFLHPPTGSGAVVRQEPVAGVVVPQHTRIQLWLQNPATPSRKP